MRAREFIHEGRTGSLADDVARALPTTYVLPELPNQDPYLQYRFGVAMAAVKGKKDRDQDMIPPFEATSAWGENQIVISADPDIGEHIDKALEMIGMSGKRLISTPTSEETADVGKVSPINSFKGWK